MSKTPPSVDELMWLLAEDPDPAALDTFARRYPEHRNELARRVRMVRELKAADPGGRAAAPPRFERRPVHERSFPRWAGVATSLLLFAGIAFGAYRVTAEFLEPPQEPAPAPVAVETTRATDREPVVRPTPVPNVGEPDRPKLEWIRPGPPVETLVSIEMNDVPLISALSELARQSGVTIEFAPDMPNPMIDLAYKDTPALFAMQDMGRSLGFTAFRQGDNSVLIVPAVDPNLAQRPTGQAQMSDQATNQDANAERPNDPERVLPR